MSSNDSDDSDQSGPAEHPSPTTPNPPEPVSAHGRGAVDAVEARWRRLPLVWQGMRARHGMTSPGPSPGSGPAFPGILPLLAAAGAEPRLRRLYPFTSHFTLVFSSCTRYPYLVEAPAVEPLHDGRFRVHGAGGGGGGGGAVIGETDTAEEAVALVMAHLPDDLGPAVAGTADDLGR